MPINNKDLFIEKINNKHIFNYIIIPIVKDEKIIILELTQMLVLNFI